jgi:hypothetical protein
VHEDLGAALACARPEDDQNRERGEARREISDKAQRSFVEPVGVVDQEHQRADLGEPSDEPVQAM